MVNTRLDLNDLSTSEPAQRQYSAESITNKTSMPSIARPDVQELYNQRRELNQQKMRESQSKISPHKQSLVSKLVSRDMGSSKHRWTMGRDDSNESLEHNTVDEEEY